MLFNLLWKSYKYLALHCEVKFILTRKSAVSFHKWHFLPISFIDHLYLYWSLKLLPLWSSCTKEGWSWLSESFFKKHLETQQDTFKSFMLETEVLLGTGDCIGKLSFQSSSTSSKLPQRSSEIKRGKQAQEWPAKPQLTWSHCSSLLRCVCWRWAVSHDWQCRSFSLAVLFATSLDF